MYIAKSTLCGRVLYKSVIIITIILLYCLSTIVVMERPVNHCVVQ